MSNRGSPKNKKRKMIAAEVVQSKMSYAAPVLAEFMEKGVILQKDGSTEIK